MAESISIPSRRWLEFIPEPRRSRSAAVWGVPLAGVIAVGLMTAILAAGGEAQGNESDGGVVEAADLHGSSGLEGPDASQDEEVAPASAIAPPEPVSAPTPAEVAPEPAAPPPAVVVPAEKPVRKRPEPPPMKPGELRRAQRVARQLHAAVVDGRVATSSLSFAVVADREGAFLSEASTLCHELAIDGVTGWRLPSVGELRDLGRARVLPGATYWSRTRGRDPETARVYNTRTRRSGAWLESDPTGATVCVHARPRE
jgi:hypothetical protein